MFSKSKKEESIDKDKALAISGVAGGGMILKKTKSGRLTGKVTRYHDAPTEVIDKIKKEGLKAKYAEDPNNLTNQVLKDVSMDKKKGLVYTAKKKKFAYQVGTQRANLSGKLKLNKLSDIKDLVKEVLGKSKHHKVLKLEFDYNDIKNQPKIKNPELRGTTNAKDFYNKMRNNMDELQKVMAPEYEKLDPITKKTLKNSYKALDSGTHIFKGDIDSSHIVGGKGYKKRTLKQVAKYIKNNPKRFGKEAVKVATGAALLGYGVKKAADYQKNKNKEKK